MKELVRQVRAQDTYDFFQGRPETDLLAPFILDKAKAKEIPIIGDPDPRVLARLNQFYAAVSLTIEQKCGIMASPVLQLSHEGFGRIVLICGRLVVVSKTLRDVHRFGFPSLEKLNAEGERLVAEALGLIEIFKPAAEL
nr:NifX-associated nitrogen fixation protein [Rhizomicrobium palustre]